MTLTELITDQKVETQKYFLQVIITLKKDTDQELGDGEPLKCPQFYGPGR